MPRQEAGHAAHESPDAADCADHRRGQIGDPTRPQPPNTIFAPPGGTSCPPLGAPCYADTVLTRPTALAASSTAATTLSGAHIRTLAVTAAETFLRRLGHPPCEPTQLALGAFEDRGALIGVAALTASSPTASHVAMGFVAERRRLHVGTDLFQALLCHQPDIGPRYLVFVHPAAASPAAQFLRSLHLVIARRVHDTTVTAVVVLPVRP